MAKKSKKRLGRHEQDEAGCMWSIFNIFDSPPVRSSQKLIPDRKCGSRPLDGAVYGNIKPRSLNDSRHFCHESNNALQNESLAISTSKMSVKQLMEDEMCGKQDDMGLLKKNHRWERSRMSLDFEAGGFVVAGNLVERPNHRKLKSCSNVDLKEMVEELSKDGELAINSIRKSSVLEKQLTEASKVLVKHFIDGITGTKELTDALKKINSNKEFFSELLRNPNSQLAKHLQSLQDDQVEEDIDIVKRPNFFWRRFKGQERNSLGRNETLVDLSKIVVLKPGPPNSKISDMDSTSSSFSESPKSSRHKNQIEKASSPFTFAVFKRKLKHAMRKQLKDDKIRVEQEPCLNVEERVSNIHTEANRYLAEIMGSGAVNLDTCDREVPKSPGRILSNSGYTSDMKDVNVGHPDQVKQAPESQSCLPSDRPIYDEPVQKSAVHCSEDIMRTLDGESQKESNFLEASVEPCSLQGNMKTVQVDSPRCSLENSYSSSSQYNTNEENAHSSSRELSTLYCSSSSKTEDLDAMSDATSRLSPISVLEPVIKEDNISPPVIKHYTVIESIRPRQIKFEEEIPVSIGRALSNRASVDDEKYTYEFVKDVIQMSGLTWDELLRRSLFADHLIDPSLIDEVDFLPEHLSCDFNLLFDLVSENVVELCQLNFGCMLSLATPSVEPNLKGKGIFSEVWKGANGYLALEGPSYTPDQLIAKDLERPNIWTDLWLDRENIGIHIQEAILDELVEDTISSCVSVLWDS